MGKTAFAVKLDKDFQKEVRDFCETRGLKQGPFVEKAIREQMEREELAEDLFDLYSLKQFESKAVSFESYQKGRR